MPHAYLPLAQGRGIERGGDVRLVLQIAVASTIVSLHSVARRLPRSLVHAVGDVRCHARGVQALEAAVLCFGVISVAL